MKYLFVFLLAFMQSINILCAQQDAQFTQYINNQLYFNPAFAGSEGLTQVSLTHRTQWAAYDASFDDGGSPNTQLLSFTTAFPKYNLGLGVHIVNDRLGPLNNLEAQLSLAYHVPLAKEQTLSFGVRAGMFSKTIDFDQYRFREAGDVFDLGGKDSEFSADFAAGLMYKSPKFFASFSATRLNQGNFDFGVDNINNALTTTLYLMAGYNYEVNADFLLTPNMLVKSELNEYSVDVGALITYREKFWGGLYYRNEESANILLGVNLERKNKKNKVQHFKIGYSLDYVFIGQEAKQPTSHEIVLSYAIPVPLPKLPAIIRTPRYRY